MKKNSDNIIKEEKINLKKKVIKKLSDIFLKDI